MRPTPPVLAALALLLSACGWPMRSAYLMEPRGRVVPIEGFEDVRAVDGYASAAFQKRFDLCANKAAARFAAHDPAKGKPKISMLVFSSGGVNGHDPGGSAVAGQAAGLRGRHRHP